jgi:hypothetical protein
MVALRGVWLVDAVVVTDAPTIKVNSLEEARDVPRNPAPVMPEREVCPLVAALLRKMNEPKPV